MIFNPISALFVLPVMLILIELGRRFRIKHKAPQESTAIENAVFALFGLLLAFTFSGAVERYDHHRQLIVEETNAIGTAYLRLDLLPPAAQPALRQLFRDADHWRVAIERLVLRSFHRHDNQFILGFW